MEDLERRKQAFRAEARRLRKVLARDRPQAASEVGRRLFQTELQLPSVVALYAPMGAELDTNPLAEALVTLDVRIALPEVVAPGAPLRFREVAGPGRALQDLRLYTALGGALLVDPLLIFTPLLAFDRLGYRLGQGGGYYDRTMAERRRASPPPRFIGLAYAGQEVEQAPLGPHDQKLDGVLTETAYLSFR